jgi:hypothetical protein
MLVKSLAFWTLVAGVIAFVAKFFAPALPFDATQILAAILFVLGLAGVVPTLRARVYGRALVAPADILKSLPFWTMVTGLVSFIVHFYAPAFPFEQSAILALVVYVLGFFQITPELRARGLR